MSHFGDFIDGVPVKISERYKRPPRIELPYTVQDCLSRSENFTNDVKYSTNFERNVLLKLKELRSLKETKRNEKRHRLQLLEEAKQKRLDAIELAKTEEKLKQLNVSEVSYPSTEEINVMSPEEQSDVYCELTKPPDEIHHKEEFVGDNGAHKDQKEIQLDILQPIPVQSNFQANNLLDDPDPLQKLKMNMKILKIPQFKNVDTMTYRDFENDTSSPFDNVELKTINDMELLSQVLENHRDVSTSCHDPQLYPSDQPYVTDPNYSTQALITGIDYMQNAYVEQHMQDPGVVYSLPQSYPNGYYNVPGENICDNTMPVENICTYVHNYQYYIPSNQCPQPGMYYNSQIPVNCENNQIQNDSNYAPQYFYSPQIVLPHPSANTTVSASNTITQVCDENQISNQNKKTRSRSVPDIVKELNDELALVKRKTNDWSYNVSPTIPTHLKPNQEVTPNTYKAEQLPNPYGKLSASLKTMCQRIHGMGFPLDRVARISMIVGENDKKVIEALLILGEIMDLGFSEDRASTVLIKHGFNRDKALDELVS